MRGHQLSFVFLLMFLASCQQRHQRDLQGVWKKHGYGQIIEITKSAIKLYDVTQKSCLSVDTIRLNDMGKLGEIIKLTPDTLVMQSGINIYQFTRLATLPECCELKRKIALKDPVYNFDVFWNTFNENYAFFEKRNIQWDAVYKAYRRKIDNTTTDHELYEILNEIIAKFKDGHITLEVPDAVVQSDQPKNKMEPTNEGSVSEIPDVSPLELRNAILKRYIRKPTIWGRDLYGNGLLNWGITKENVGYVQVNWMLFYHDYNIPDSLKGGDYVAKYFQKAESNPSHMNEEVEQARKIMDRIVKELKDVDGIILDIRLNGGGYDGVALEILNHFATERTIAFSKKTWLGKTFSEPLSIYVSPSKKTFSGPVILLTSHSTASAAEIMAMASMGLKNFSRVGSATEGIFSDRLEKKLPNGWHFSLSNQVYVNSSNENFENSGIAPTINFAYPQEANTFRYSILKNIRAGDPAIDTAVLLINKTK